ncbi:response regulator transcription factor [Priestia flexa]|uniref:response regulator transcription factor n=1 Tax=Bacillaceae TaxID=186817 RepID=UPI0004733F37|nr:MULTISPECIES: response regulator transcription factor [Bacillaceae]KZB90262.1 DNA-binding response regulator [Bacillus sp. VT 712]MBY6088409.1 response regulator transcription factor [Priestia flexa]MCM3065767.1 response regulator transcription factor [Priestia flexa]MCP1188911.1 response regulator transcription factor [Priestia flexa]QCS53543.1 response regulator transcription factor [Priestia flexa]
MPTILLVDDEVRMLDLLELYLAPHGFSCMKCEDSTEVEKYLEKNPMIQLVLLDLMMPKKDGWTVCQEIRAKFKVPIIMLTARDQTEDVVKGLNSGADDYITKPFSEEELLARIQAVLRRTGVEKKGISYKELYVNEESREVIYVGESISMTKTEFELLCLFLKHPNRVFPREDLVMLIWGYDTEIEGRTVDSHMRNVREKLRSAGFPIEQHLQTVWGVGYKWGAS